MVSLNQARGGFFHTEIATDDTEPGPDLGISPHQGVQPSTRGHMGISGASLLEGSSLGSSTVIRTSARDNFKCVFTGYLSLFELLILSIYTLACFVDIYALTGDRIIVTIFKNKFSFYSLLHVFLWIFVFIIDRLTQYSHRKIRLRGYLKLYLQLRNVRRVPLIVYSFGIAAILLVFSLERHLTYLVTFSTFQFDYFITIIVGIEMIASGAGLLFYFWLTLKFNLTRPRPDTIGTEGHAVTPFLSPPPEIGFSRGDTDNIEELLDKQADMIRYLKAHNANLARKINELQDRLGPPNDN